MGKKITEMGYKATAVVCGKFFDLDNVMGLKEMAEYYGGEYDAKWEDDDRQLVQTFERDGFEFIGCVAVKSELEEAGVELLGGYLVRGKLGYGNAGNRRRIYVVADFWDESKGQGECRAYRYNVFTRGSFDYNDVERVYRQVRKAQG